MPFAFESSSINRRSMLALLVAVTLAALPAHSQSPAGPAALPISPATAAAVRQLLGDTILNGQAYEYDRQLADTIGPRLTGSANYMRAADWALGQFKTLGLVNVHKEEWTIPATWEPEGPAVGHILSPVDHQFHVYSFGWSPSTPKEGITGDVVYVPSIIPADTDKLKDKLHGAIALLDMSSFGEKEQLEVILGGLEHLKSLSPAAIVLTGGADGTERLSADNFSGKLAPIPEAEIGEEDSLLIKRLLEHGPVKIQFAFTNRIRTEVKVPNVIAEIRGSETPDEVVIVGAHLDSWQPGTGAQDNGTGVAGVLEAARAIQSLNRPPRRTLRFILFGGEEEGLLGSTAYARQHLAEVPKIDAILISDTGAQPAKGWYLMGREDEKPAVDSLKPLLRGLGADGTTSNTRFIFETDHAALDVLGVPSLVLWNDMDKYFTLHHKASDTFDSVVEKDLTQGAAVLAITAYAVADSSQPLARHLSADEVQDMLKKSGNTDSYNYLKKSGGLP
jgi:carboxypeptidase Q